jgi:apolipoprotein N-acyltransferase
MHAPLLWSCLLALASGWFGFANPWLHIPPAVLAVPAAFCLIGLKADSRKQAFRFGFLGGLLMFAACIYWVAIPVHDFAFLPWILAAPCPLLLAAYMALFSGVFSMEMRWLALCLESKKMGTSSVFLYALFGGCLWALFEWTRCWLGTGFPWIALAQAFAPWPFAIQTLALVGSHGVAALFGFASCLLAAPFALPGAGPRSRIVAFSASGLCLALMLGYGFYALGPGDKTHQTGTIPVSLIQGNIDQSQKWDKAFQRGTVDKYLSMSLDAVNIHAPELVIMPETAMPFYFQEPSENSNLVRGFAVQTGVSMLLGAPGYTPDKTAKEGYALYNRAFLLNKNGNVIKSYDKEHLVPFGEYVPLDGWLPLGKLVEGIGDFRPGRDPSPLRIGSLALGALICYEAIFPELAQGRVAAGANALVNISNDAWYGRSSAAEQHLHLSILRAVEQGRWLIRATNTGISAVVDAKGRVHSRTGVFTTEILNDRVAIETDLTVFHRLQPYLPGALLGLVLAIGLYARRGQAALERGRPETPQH